MERIKNLDKTQKIILILTIAALVLFTVIYPVFFYHTGIRYHGKMLTLTIEDNKHVYSGKLDGKKIKFTVDGNRLDMTYGDAQIVPYYVCSTGETPEQASTFVLQSGPLVVFRRGEVLFRGTVSENLSGRYYYTTNRTTFVPGVLRQINNTCYDMLNNVVINAEPNIDEIIWLLEMPSIHKNDELAVFWVFGAIICIVNIISIIFVEELFRLRYVFSVADPYAVEPSELTLIMRPISWGLTLVIALLFFFTGLKFA